MIIIEPYTELVYCRESSASPLYFCRPDQTGSVPVFPFSTQEKAILLVLAAVQFINILDFMMVMPLGPDFALVLNIPPSHLGYVGAAYTLSAAFWGLAAASFLDRFNRRSVLALSMLGLFIGTALGALAWDLNSLLLARVLAGAFGGPASAACFSIVADTIDSRRRGRAMGFVMGAFPIAAVAGVPFALEAARLAGWRAPFLVVAIMGVVTAVAAWRLLPPLAAHLASGRRKFTPAWVYLGRPMARWSLAAVAMAYGATFVIVPNISAYIQFNLGYPRDSIGLLYLFGGGANFMLMRYIGRMVDRWGAIKVGYVASVTFLLTLFAGFFSENWHLPIVMIFVFFMVTNGARSVSLNTLLSLVPASKERASFQATQSAVTHMAASVGALLSSMVLSERTDGALAGMPQAVWLSAAMCAALPVFLYMCRQLEDKCAGQSVPRLEH
jgi:predicted MFS family arabinose efflux permease